MPLKGVNLGGWLIAERWMTPAVFEGTDAQDEFTLGQTDTGKAAITKHRDTFITEEDFQWISKHLDIVRLPVGYWMFDGDGPLQAQVKYVDWVMEMAVKYDILVLLDLHGLQGSQNGYDHSGHKGEANWFKDKAYREASLETLRQIAERYKDHPKLWGIQVINEPKFGIFHFKLRAYYRRARGMLGTLLSPETKIIFSDGFTPRLMNGAMGRTRQATMDAHLYHATKFWTAFASLKFYYWSLGMQKLLIKWLSWTQPVIVGEWSGSFRQPIFDQFPVSQHGKLVGDHAQRQIASFEHAAAWFYWNYKTEKTGVWHFRSQVDEGYIRL